MEERGGLSFLKLEREKKREEEREEREREEEVESLEKKISKEWGISSCRSADRQSYFKKKEKRAAPLGSSLSRFATPAFSPRRVASIVIYRLPHLWKEETDGKRARTGGEEKGKEEEEGVRGVKRMSTLLNEAFEF